MNKAITKLLTLMIFIAFMQALITSCSTESKKSFSTSSIDEDKLGYRSSVFTVDLDNIESYSINNAFASEDKYYISMTMLVNSDDGMSPNTIYEIDLSSDSISVISIPQGEFVCCCCGDYLLSLNGNTINKYDPQTGEFISSVDCSNLPPIYQITATDSGYILQGEGFIDVRDSSDNSLGSITDSGIVFEGEVFTDDGSIYYCAMNGGKMEYYLLDIENSKLEFIADSEDMDNVLSVFCRGKYIFDGYTIRHIDLDEQSINLIADLDYIDIKPSSGRLTQPTVYDIIDDQHFAVIDQYDNKVEIQTFTYDPQIDTSYDSILEIGGYGLREDPALQWAVYLFNTTQEDTRAIMTDYANEGYGYDNAEQAASAKAELIKLFNEGNAPDIFYGDSFDYDYFGRNDMVIDLYPYLAAELKLISPEASALMINEAGKCYKLFSSYMLDGFFAHADVVDTDDLSFRALGQLQAISDSPLMRGLTYAQILDSIIRYEIPARLDRNGNYFTVDELIAAIEYAVSFGYEDSSSAWAANSSEPILNPAILGDYQAYAYYYPGMRFVGYPSFESTNRVAKPIGLMAISSGCDKPDKAWELIRMLYSEQVQDSCILNWSYPVTVYGREKYLSILEGEEETAGSVFDYITDDIIRNDELIDAYTDIMSSVNVLQTNDWGVYNIISDEMLSYSQGKSIPEIASSLQSRLELYIEENYG